MMGLADQVSMFGKTHTDVFGVRVDEIRVAASSFRAVAAGLDAELARLGQDVSAMRERWTGMTSEAFRGAFDAWTGRMAGREAAARLIASALDDIADDYEATSRKVASLWAGSGSPFSVIDGSR